MNNHRVQMLAGFVVLASALAHAIAPWVKIYGRRYLALAGLVAVVVLAARRTFWLPFLGEAAFPAAALGDRDVSPRGANATATVRAPKNATIVYWAASVDAPGPKAAYAEGSNAGVARASASGGAVLRVRRPGVYAVGGAQLKPHVHYRVVESTGMLGPVQTAPVGPPAKDSVMGGIGMLLA
jgi:hypothetical protein